MPRAERVIARTFKSSTLMVSKRRAKSVVVFSTQSRRRSVSRARTFAMASLVRAPGRSALRPGQTLLQAAQPFGFAGTKARSMQQFPAGQGSRDRYTAIHTSHAVITGAWMGSGITAKAMCQRPERSKVTR